MNFKGQTPKKSEAWLTNLQPVPLGLSGQVQLLL